MLVPALADLESDERHHLVAQRARVDVRSPPGDDSLCLEPVEAGLDGATGHAETPGRLEHPDARLGAEEGQDAGVEGVNRLLHAM